MRAVAVLLAAAALSACASDTAAQPAAAAWGDGFKEFAEYSLILRQERLVGC